MDVPFIVYLMFFMPPWWALIFLIPFYFCMIILIAGKIQEIIDEIFS